MNTSILRTRKAIRETLADRLADLPVPPDERELLEALINYIDPECYLGVRDVPADEAIYLEQLKQIQDEASAIIYAYKRDIHLT